MKTQKILVITALSAVIGVFACNDTQDANSNKKTRAADTAAVFMPPDTSAIPHNELGEMIRYGRDLVLNTAYYIGPNGTKGKYLGNKMNCTNCHLDAGTRPYGYNYFGAHARYPQYRARENQILSLGQRINNCVERPHSGTPLPLDSKEIIAIECYIAWVGTGAKIGAHVKGDEQLEIEYMDRAADPQKGEVIYMKHCASCHQKNGEGLFTPDSATYVYPPLWGMKSYQKGSSPHRVVKVARFVKANMPNKLASFAKPVLTDEECLDVAAFINDDRIHPRPEKKHPEMPDYPNKTNKPIDYGTGPYTDTFSEMQHKFGPYKPIIKFYEDKKLKVRW